MIRNIAFALSMLLYIGFPLQMISTYEEVLEEGEVYRFKPQPVDPYHPFKGRYVYLNYGNLELTYDKAEEVFEQGSVAYVSLEKDSLGIAYPAAIHLHPPSEKVYVQVEVGWVYENKVPFTYPFDEYYMNEEMAPRAEVEVQNFSNPERQEVFVDVRIKGGKAVIEQLFVKDTPIEDFLREKRD